VARPQACWLERTDQAKLFTTLTQFTGEVAGELDPIAEQGCRNRRLGLDHNFGRARQCFT